MRDIPQSSTSDTGACKGSSGYYSKAKAAYQSFKDAIKIKINADDLADAAKARFSAWARANGETASFSGTTLTVNGSAINVISTITGTDSTTMIVVLISAVAAIGGIGGYFLLRKKKEN